MEGVAFHLVIGGLLFTTIGFFIALIRDKKED